MRVRRVIVLFALLLCVGTAYSAQNNNIIRGKVRGPNGVTVNNAIVELRIGGGGMLAQTVTRNDGDFAFQNVEKAEYEISVTLAGYEPAVEIVRFKLPTGMSSLEVLTVEIQLRPKAEVLLAPPGVSFVQEVPKEARAAYEKGVTRLREGKSQEAIDQLRRAIGLFENYFNAHVELGSELYRKEKYDEALQELEQARQVNDREPAVWYLFGLVMVKQKKVSIAEYAFKEAVRLNPNHLASRYNRGLMLIELGLHGNDANQRAADLVEAEKELKECWDLSGKRLGIVHFHLYRIHQSRGDYKTAAGDLENYLKADPAAKNAPAIRSEINRLRNGKN